MEEQEYINTQKNDLNDSVEYTRRVFEHNLDWYKNADTKAEVILTLDGIFLAFVTSSVFLGRAQLLDIFEYFSPLSWFLLVLMSFCLTGSIIIAIACLWSRIPFFTKRSQEKYFADKGIDAENVETYLPETTNFFQKISWLNPDLYREVMLGADKQFEISALAIDIHALSKNVSLKHKWVDLGFLFTGFSLLFILAFGVSFLLSLRYI